MLICKIAGNNKIVVEGKIVETSIGARVGDVEEILIEALLCRVESANHAGNTIVSNKVIAAGGSKKEVGI